MYKNNWWFSLIEVIIATWIISISVFWVYKLIGENTKIITNSWNYTQAYSLFPVTKECLNYIWIDWILNKTIWESYWIYLWNTSTWCVISNSWITIDNIDYYLTAVITNTWVNFIDWKLNITSDQINMISSNFKQIKK